MADVFYLPAYRLAQLTKYIIIGHSASHLIIVLVIRPLSRIFQKIRLAEPCFRLISGLAEFLRKLQNSAENTPEHHKFGQQDRQIETIKFKI